MTEKEFENLKEGDSVFVAYINGAGNKYPKAAKSVGKKILFFGEYRLVDTDIGEYSISRVFLSEDEAFDEAHRLDVEEHRRRMRIWEEERKSEKIKKALKLLNEAMDE